MQSLEAELERARDLSVSELADPIESIGFECTRCGACCTAEGAEGSGDDGGVGDEGEAHTATVFPDEVRTLVDDPNGGKDYEDTARDRTDGQGTAEEGRTEQGIAEERTAKEGLAEEGTTEEGTAERGTAEEWRDVARPMPYGLSEGDDGDLEGETFEWALQTNACGDCAFYEEDDEGIGGCVAHEDRPLICRTYPFSVALAGTSQPMGEAVDEEGLVRAHECEGLGRDISRADAEDLADALKERAVRELEEAIAVRDNYEPASPDAEGVVVHDSEGAKRVDGTPIDE